MRAFVLPELGATPQVSEVEVPEPGPGEVRVEVRAASVNGFDLAVANGYLHGLMEHRFPVVLGKDFAGTVDAVGDGVDDYRVGDRVFGVVTKPYLGDGSFAEQVTVPVSVGLAALPEAVDFVAGATLGLAGAAASAAVDAAQLEAGQTVLVVGATGGVGNLAVQLASRRGATVIATAATPQERQLVLDLGADEVVDHTGDLAGAVRAEHPHGVDAVLHLAGDGGLLLPLVRDGGRLVSTLVSSPDQLPSDHVDVVGIYADPDASTLARLVADHGSGATRVPVQGTFALDEASEALSAFSGGTLGKIVITI